MKFRYLYLLFFLPFLINWMGDFSSPEKCFQSLLSAAESNDIANFIECCDIEALAGITGTEDNKQLIMKSLEEDHYRKQFINDLLNYLNHNRFKITETIPLSSKMVILVVKNIKTDEVVKLVFTEKNRDWKLSNAKLK